LLNTDYKLLTKVFVGRLMGVLPSVLQKSQLCSVRGRNIMQGAISLLSTAEFVQQRKRRGLMLNLDVYHAYDRVCLPYIDRVLAALGFGTIFREMVLPLHGGASASFLFYCIMLGQCPSVSQCQGQIAMLL
jgi:hypothetical protein